MQWLRKVCWEEKTKHDLPYLATEVAVYFHNN